jgi:hypothetical protein
MQQQSCPSKCAAGVIVAALVVLLTACRSTPERDAASASQPEVAPPAGVVVIREYVDPQKVDGVDAYFRIRYAWDYDQGSAVMQRYDMDGKLLETVPQPGLTLESTDAEMAYAYQLVRNDPEFATKVARPDAVYQGGFSVRGAEFPPCGDGSRCVRVFVQAGADATIPLVNVIVDLAKRRIVARDGREAAITANKGAGG